jgi:hypothetical protein
MDERDFTEAIPQVGAQRQAGTVRVSRVALPELCEVAGDIVGFHARHPARELGCGGDVSRPGAALVRLARDRALWRPDGQLPALGWQASGWAALPVGAAWAGIAISGPGAEDLVRQGVALDLVDGSPSAAVSWRGHRVVLLRAGPDWQIWCSTAEIWAIWAWLDDPDG